jgi:PIN domain nuclease of toxin-antitoxin system
VRVLVDTHILLWAWHDDPRLTASLRAILSTAEIVVSAVTVWEIEVKRRLGKLAVDGDVQATLTQSGCIPLPVTWRHAVQAAALPMHHADPFDRLLIAQGMIEDLPILTADRMFHSYAVTLA